MEFIETPCLLLDKSKLTNNIHRMNVQINKHNVKLCLHGKTAKCIEIIKLALEGHDACLTASTLKEAEYFFEEGISDIIYAIGIVPVKLEKIAGLIKRGANIKIILDSTEQVRFVSESANKLGVNFKIMIEIDSDSHRAGVKPDGELLLTIGKLLTDMPGVSLEGVLTHAGASYTSKTIDEIKSYAQQERDAAVLSAERLRNAGFGCPIVSVGSTPTATFAEDLSGITQVRTGVYLFHDLMMAKLGVCKVSDIAVSVLASVIGHQKERNRLLTDSGWTALSGDRGLGDEEDFGLVCDVDGNPISDLYVCGTSQEHGIVTSRSGANINFQDFPVGTQVRILPQHACSTSTMHNSYKVMEGQQVLDEWKRFNGWYM